MLATLTLSGAISVEKVVWLITALIVVGGALGTVFSSNPIHNALSLVATLFGVAVMFVIQKAYFLAAIQIIVYAGAIVILFMFVIMLLGVDRFELLRPDRRPWRRPLTVLFGLLLVGLVAFGGFANVLIPTGRHSVDGSLGNGSYDINRLGMVLFTKYLWAFEITGVLLTVAVVGAVVLSRKPLGDAIDIDEFPVDEDDRWADLPIEWTDEYVEPTAAAKPAKALADSESGESGAGGESGVEDAAEIAEVPSS